MAGGTTRFDVSFSDIDIFYNTVDPGSQTIATADPGRYYSAFGWSNVDVDICWNLGTSYTSWASEVYFAMTMDDGAGTALYYLASPFAGDNTGSDVQDACSNRQALAELQTDFAPFTYSVDGATGDVVTGMMASWNDGTGLRHSHCNTADFFFVLAGPIPAGCDGATGSCGEVHATPGCEDVSCCALTCDVNSGGDSFCCDVEWDSTCVDLAIALCGIFQYSCDAPAFANDCATSPELLANGGSAAFSTIGANYDGPIITCAADGGPNVWYLVEIDAATDQSLTATTCDAADYDTALTLWDAGLIGSTFDPATLPDALVVCNDDGAGCTGYTSTLVSNVLAGHQYLISVSGYQGATGTGTITVSWEDPTPPLPAPECTTPGDTAVTQFVTDPAALTVSGGVWCGAGAENVVCRSYPAAALGGAFDVSCVDFGWFFNDADYMPGIVNLYKSNQMSPIGATLELIDTTEFGLYGVAGYTISSCSFAAPVTVDLVDGEYLIVELRIQRQLATAGTGYGGYFGVTLADTDGSEGYLSCGADYFGTMTDIGFGDYQPYIVFNGTGGGAPACTGDFNDDGIVNGADFGSILAAWGPCAGCAEDLNGDGQVTGADVGLLLSVWGVCP
jgi:hypothetical protein